MKTHTTLSRRDFMKALGIGAVGIGTAAVAAPVASDLDDLMGGSSAVGENRPWWIKEKDKPTVNIDWDMQVRGDGRISAQQYYVWYDYLPAEEVNAFPAKVEAAKAEGLKNQTAALDAKSVALYDGSFQAFENVVTNFMVDKQALTELYPGTPQYSGTPEENSRMIRAALRFFGAGQVSFGVFDDNFKYKVVIDHQKVPVGQLFFPPPQQSREVVYEDVDKGYIDVTKLVLPNKQLYHFTMNVPMAKEGYRTGPNSAVQMSSNINRYRIFSQIHYSIQVFIARLGYTCYGYSPMPMMGLVPSIAAGQLTGLCEGARNNGVAITPEYGPVNGYFTMFTDLPLAPTKPIDAGIWKFCQTCQKCATACPSQSIPYDKTPTYDIPDIYGKPDKTHLPGREQFWYNAISCWQYVNEGQGCGTCMSTCTFNTNSSTIHEVVRATLSTTSLFNGFMWRADNWFGYGLIEDKASWWDMSLPVNGWDSTYMANDGRY